MIPDHNDLKHLLQVATCEPTYSATSLKLPKKKKWADIRTLDLHSCGCSQFADCTRIHLRHQYAKGAHDTELYKQQTVPNQHAINDMIRRFLIRGVSIKKQAYHKMICTMTLAYMFIDGVYYFYTHDAQLKSSYFDRPHRLIIISSLKINNNANQMIPLCTLPSNPIGLTVRHLQLQKETYILHSNFALVNNHFHSHDYHMLFTST